MRHKAELLAPAGSLSAALAAWQYGADAIYLGLPQFSARADATNLTLEELRLLRAYAQTFQPAKKLYVAFNTLVQEHELKAAIGVLAELETLGIDALIVQDLGIAHLVRRHFPGLALHASTQLAVHNLAGVTLLRQMGFKRVVLARELSLSEAHAIARGGGLEVEFFIHGALCYSVSGLCLFSSMQSGRSGNRGRCAYSCRAAFAPTKGGAQTNFPFSMCDLALAEYAEQLQALHSLKIEGRMKSPLYVACVTDYYRRLLDRQLTPAAARELQQDLQTIFSRPWSTLHVGSTALSERNPHVIEPLAVGHHGALVGQVKKIVRERGGRHWVRFSTQRALERYDGLQIVVEHAKHQGRPWGFPVHKMRLAGRREAVVTVPAASMVEVELPAGELPTIATGCAIYCSASQAVQRRYAIQGVRASELPLGLPVDFTITLQTQGILVTACTRGSRTATLKVTIFEPFALTPARDSGKTVGAVERAFQRLGASTWYLKQCQVLDAQGLYASPKQLNHARRAILAALDQAWQEQCQHRVAAVQAAVCARPDEIAAGRAQALGGAPQLPAYALKAMAGALPPASALLARLAYCVLNIGHTPSEILWPALQRWQAVVPRAKLVLALPLLARDLATAPGACGESERLGNLVQQLVAAGWDLWECADLSGIELLRQVGLVPWSTDWSLYVHNCSALAALHALGSQRVVLSAEHDSETILALGSAGAMRGAPWVEALAFQHTPLFIAEQPPASQGDKMVREGVTPARHLWTRTGEEFVVSQQVGRWVTTNVRPFCVNAHLGALGIQRARLDFSWHPGGVIEADLLALLLAGATPPQCQMANFERGLR